MISKLADQFSITIQPKRLQDHGHPRDGLLPSWDGLSLIVIPSQGWAILYILWDGPCLLKVSGVFDFFVSIPAGYTHQFVFNTSLALKYVWAFK